MAKVHELLGRRSEDMPFTPNYEENDGKDVTGNAFSINTRGNDTMTATVMFNKLSGFAKKIDNIIERRLELSDLEVTLIVARKYKRIGTDFDSGLPSAYKQTAVIVPTSYAPGNADLNSEVNIKFTGPQEFGTFAPGERSKEYKWLYENATFVAETAPPTSAQIHYKDGDASREDFGIFFEYDDAEL